MNWECLLIGHNEYVDVTWQENRPHDHPIYVDQVFLICKRCGNIKEGTEWDLGYHHIGD